MSESPETDALFYAMLKDIHSREEIQKIWPLVRLCRKFEKQVLQQKRKEDEQ